MKNVRRYVSFALLLVVAAVLLATLLPTTITPAIVQVIGPAVEVDVGRGFVEIEEDRKLSRGDIVRTGEGGEAIIVIYEAILVRLSENTQVEIETLLRDNAELKQTSGTVWSKVMRLSPVSYSVQTPTTTATVRGTAFQTEYSTEGFALLVAEGSVGAEPNGSEENIPVQAPSKLVGGDDGYSELPLTRADRQAILEELTKDLDEMKELRVQEVLKHKLLMLHARIRHGVGEDDVRKFFIDLDSGRYREEDIILDISPMTPAMRKSVERIKKYNAEIAAQTELIASYET